MTETEFPPQNPGMFPDGLFATDPAATLCNLDCLTQPILASGLRQV